MKQNKLIRGFDKDPAGKNLKPYQGLKLEYNRHNHHPGNAGKNLKPYQGLKLAANTLVLFRASRKKPKTLSGIETSQHQPNL